ncbi:hypothetical protein ACHAW5_001860 [Stephanodiscus triporus]|uniref:Tocopherol cyclase n=1 Tax=Stephanodiscus triporus TaxID=2934178 RepID=A0ABD3PQV2_9STRA
MIGKAIYSILLLLLAPIDRVGCFVAVPTTPPPQPVEQGQNQGRSNTFVVEAARFRSIVGGPNMQMSNKNDDAAATYKDSPYLMDEKRRPTGVRDKLLLQSPHSGRKFRPTHPNSSSTSRLHKRLRSLTKKLWTRMAKKPISNFLARNNRRFTEGWYYRLTLPEHNESFCFIFSIEDAGRYINGKKKSPLTLACMQMLGPKDTYLVQSDENDTKFWAWKDAHALGCTFEWKKDFVKDAGESEDLSNIAALTPEEWRIAVQSGFQILPFNFQGRLCGHDGTLGGVKVNQGKAGIAEYDFDVRPVAGWGNYPSLLSSHHSNSFASDNEHNQEKNNYRQFSTAGWLASFPVFEPHWQITMAHARASGSINWNGTVYHFNDAPFYGEKNWGGAFPTKWYWAQCNSFDGYPDLSMTSGGGIRNLPFFPGMTETLGLIGIHYEGHFYEIVPWTGEMSWEVWPWGRWEFRGRCTDKKGESSYEAEIVAVTDDDVSGVLLRAPTKEEGMQYFCRDSGFGNVVLSLWELKFDEDIGDFVRARTVIDRARSGQCTVEVGGGPWYDVWRVKSKMSTTMRRLIRLPMNLRL